MRAFLATAIAAGILASSASQPIAQGGPFQISVTLPAGQAAQPVDGRLLVMIAKDPKAGRAAVPDQRQHHRAADLRRRRRRLEARRVGDGRRLGARLPAREHQRHSRRHLFGAGADPQVRNVQAIRRPHREAADGSRRRAAMGARAGESLQHAGQTVSFDPKKGGTIKTRARQGDRAATSTERHQVRQTREHPERAADEILGPADASRRARAAAGRMGHASGREVSALHLSRPLPRRSHQLARDAARPQPRARLRGALQLEGLQPHAAGIRVAVLQGMDRRRISRARS